MLKQQNGIKTSTTTMLLVAGLIFPMLSAISANATEIESAALNLVLDDLTEESIALIIQGLTGSRGAFAFADTCKGLPETKSSGTSFFGDTGLLVAQSSDPCGNKAEAQARNKLIGKVNTATARGNAIARSRLSWKGRVVWIQDAVNPQPNNLVPFNNLDLPDPNNVLSASVEVNYGIDIETIQSNVNELNDSVFEQGYAEIIHLWNIEESFNGAVRMQTSGLPIFEGDLIAYSSEFTNSGKSINASNLILEDTFSFDINYEDFFNTGEIARDFEGQMTAFAQNSGDCCTVPEPSSTIGIVALGLIGGGAILKGKLKSANSTEK